MSNDICPICKSTCSKERCSDGRNAFIVNCQRCSEFTIAHSAHDTFLHNEDYTPRQRAIASSVLVTKGPWEMIGTNDKVRLFEAKDIPVTEKANKLLLEFEKRCSYVGKELSLIKHQTNDLLCTCWILDEKELIEFMCHLINLKFIRGLNPSSWEENRQLKFTITHIGWEKIEQLKNNIPESNQGFVAMWFKNKEPDDMLTIYDKWIDPAIYAAGYKPFRIDKKEHTNKIEDEIIAEIRKSKFLVADMTGHRGGVYYEAGFAHGLGLEVILTCRTDYFDELHFDLNHYNCIKWSPDKLEDFKKALTRRIKAKFGQGPVVEHDKDQIGKPPYLIKS